MSEKTLIALDALKRRLDERASVQPPFPFTWNPNGKTAVSFVTQPGNSEANARAIAQQESFREFRSISRQIVPLLQELGETIEHGLLDWMWQRVQNEKRPCPPELLASWEKKKGRIIAGDHPYRLVSLALELFLAEIRNAEGGGQEAEKVDGKQEGTLSYNPEEIVDPGNFAKRWELDPKQRERLRKALEKWRSLENSDEWIERQDRKPHQSMYLYRLGSIKHLIDAEINKMQG